MKKCNDSSTTSALVLLKNIYVHFFRNINLLCYAKKNSLNLSSIDVIHTISGDASATIVVVVFICSFLASYSVMAGEAKAAAGGDNGPTGTSSSSSSIVKFDAGTSESSSCLVSIPSNSLDEALES